MGQVAEAFVRIRPDFSGFKTSTLSGVKSEMQAVSREAEKVGQTVSIAARETVAAEVKKRAALKESLEAYKAVATQAKRGSEEQIAANRLAASSASQLGMSVKQAGVHARGAEQEVSALSRGVLRGTEAFKGFNSALVFGGASFVGAAGITEAVTKSIEAASSLEEQISRTTDVFGQSSAAVLTWSKTTSNAFGISREESLNAAATIGTLLQNVGVATDKASEMSKAFVQLSSDMAAFKKTSPEEAFSALESALAGRSIALKKFGIVIDSTMLKAEALSSGILKSSVNLDKVRDSELKVGIAQEKLNVAAAKNGANSVQAAQATLALEAAHKGLEKATAGSTGQLNAQQRALATYNLILKQSHSQQGAFAKDSGELAVQQMRFRANLSDLEAEIGTALLPTVTKYTSELANWMSEAKESGDIQREVTKVTNLFESAVRAASEAAKVAAAGFGILSKAIGGNENAFKLLIGATAIWKTRGVANAVAGFIAVGDSAVIAETKVIALRNTLGGLAGKVIPITIALSLVNKSPVGQKALDRIGLGFMGHIPLLGGAATQFAGWGAELAGGVAPTAQEQIKLDQFIPPASLAHPGYDVQGLRIGSQAEAAFAAKALAAAKERANKVVVDAAGGGSGSIDAQIAKILKQNGAGTGAIGGGGSIPDLTAGAGSGGSKGLSATAVASMRQHVLDLIDRTKGIFPESVGKKLAEQGQALLASIHKGLGDDASAKLRSDITKLSGSITTGLSLDKATDRAKDKLDEFQKKVSAAPQAIQTKLAPGMARVREELGTVVTQKDLNKAKSDYNDLTSSLSRSLKQQRDALKAHMTALTQIVKSEQAPFETAFGNVANIALTLFDRNVQKHIDGMTAELNTKIKGLDDQLNATLATIQANQSALTYSEQLVKDMEDAKNTADLASAITAAQKQVTDDAAASAKNIADASASLDTAKANLAAAQNKGPSQAVIQQLRDQLSAAEANVAANQDSPTSSSALAAGTAYQRAQRLLTEALAQSTDPNTLADLQKAVTDAEQAVTDAKSGAADQQVSDAKALEDALYNQKLDGLQRQAELERAAADKTAADATTAAQNLHDQKAADLQAQYNLDVQNYQDQESLQRDSLQQQLADLEKHLETRGTTVATANAELLKLITAFGLDPTWFTAGQNSASALVQGLATALAGASSTLIDLQNAEDAVQAAKNLIAGGTSTQPVGSNENPHDGTTNNADILAELKKQTALAASQAKTGLKVTVTSTGAANANQVARNSLR